MSPRRRMPPARDGDRRKSGSWKTTVHAAIRASLQGENAPISKGSTQQHTLPHKRFRRWMWHMTERQITITIFQRRVSGPAAGIAWELTRSTGLSESSPDSLSRALWARRPEPVFTEPPGRRWGRLQGGSRGVRAARLRIGRLLREVWGV